MTIAQETFIVAANNHAKALSMPGLRFVLEPTPAVGNVGGEYDSQLVGAIANEMAAALLEPPEQAKPRKASPSPA